MIHKIKPSHHDALSVIPNGARMMVGGFGHAGVPYALIDSLLELGTTDLTIISNNAGAGTRGVAALIAAGRVRRIICSHPRPPNAEIFIAAYRAGQIELECVPQGTLAERMRAAGAGLGPFFTPTGYGTLVAEGKQQCVIDGKGYILEQPLSADFALVKAHQGDRLGNLTYRLASRNFNPVMCMAARHAIAQVDHIVAAGDIAPEHVMTPAVFVQAVVPSQSSQETAHD